MKFFSLFEPGSYAPLRGITSALQNHNTSFDKLQLTSSVDFQVLGRHIHMYIRLHRDSILVLVGTIGRNNTIPTGQRRIAQCETSTTFE